MSMTWILVANSTQAHIYAIHKALLFKPANGHDQDYLKLVKELHNEEARKKSAELVSDKSGAFKTGSFVEPIPKELEADRFARSLANELEHGRVAGAYDDLVIVASPHFQGLINKHLDDLVSRLIVSAIEKDYTHLKEHDLVAQLREHF